MSWVEDSAAQTITSSCVLDRMWKEAEERAKDEQLHAAQEKVRGAGASCALRMEVGETVAFGGRPCAVQNDSAAFRVLHVILKPLFVSMSLQIEDVCTV